MSGITTRTAYGKLQKPNATDKDIRNESFVTGQPIGSNRKSLDVIPVGLTVINESMIVEAGSNDFNITFTGHGAKVGDVVRILSSANSVNEFEIHIDKIVDEDNFELSSVLSAALIAGDEIALLRPISQKLASDGSTIGSLQFFKNGEPVLVNEDTVTPANNIPLPVKLTSFEGDITLNAQQINVNLDDQNDSVAIGDGSGNILGVTANPLKTQDNALATAIGLQAKLTDTQPISAASLPLPTGAATESSLSSINTKTPALVSGRVPVDGSGVTQPVSVSSLPLPSGAATETTLSGILSDLQLKADKTETQPVSLASVPLPSGAATETTLTSILSDLQLKADKTEAQPISATSLPLPTGAATEVTLGNILTELGLKADSNETQPVSVASLPLPSGAATETTLSTLNGKIPTIGQKNMAGSISVTIASDQPNTPLTIEGTLDSGNSSTTLLDANEVFTGTWIDIKNFNAISVGVFSDVPSATNGLRAEYSYDGASVHHVHVFTYAGTNGTGYNFTSEFRYFRLKYTNGGTDQASFNLISILKPTALFPSSYRISTTLTDETQSIITKSLISGKTTGGGGGYVDVKVNPSGALVTQATITGTVPLPTGAATETTLESILSDLQLKADKTETQPVSASSLPLPTGAATETTLSSLLAKTAGSLVPLSYDQVVQTYVGATSDLNTVTFKNAGTTVATLTFTYDGSNRLIDVART
jgi:hypothetical protein